MFAFDKAAADPKHKFGHWSVLIPAEGSGKQTIMLPAKVSCQELLVLVLVFWCIYSISSVPNIFTYCM